MLNDNRCIHCNTPLNPDADFCTKCGNTVPKCEDNHCENPRCIRNDQKFDFGDDGRFCDKCGKPTTLGRIVEEHI